MTHGIEVLQGTQFRSTYSIPKGSRFDFKDTPIRKAVSSAVLGSAEATETPMFLWGNPDIKLPQRNVKKSEVTRLTISILLNSLGLLDSRKMWSLNPTLPNQFISKVREETAFGTVGCAYTYAGSLIALHRAQRQRLNDCDLTEIFEECGIEDGCHVVHDFLKQTGSINAAAKTISDDIPLTYKDLYVECHNFVTSRSVLNQIRMRVFKKLRFISYDATMSVDDITHEIMMGVMAVYLHVRPFVTRKHAENKTRSFIQTCTLRTLYAYSNYEQKKFVWQNEDGSFTYRNRYGFDGMLQVGPEEFVVGEGRSSTSNLTGGPGNYVEDGMIEHLDEVSQYW